MNGRSGSGVAERLVARARQLWREGGEDFFEERVLLWPHLSRLAGLLIVLNVSLFFVPGAARCGGEYWPVKSLGLLALVELAMLWPRGWLRRLEGYAALTVLWLAAAGYFAAAVRFWLDAI